jgi:hypothetical protein
MLEIRGQEPEIREQGSESRDQKNSELAFLRRCQGAPVSLLRPGKPPTP